MNTSKLQEYPRSKVLENGYINIYSELNPKEKRQAFYKTLYKNDNSNWDETMVYLAKQFNRLAPSNCRTLDAGCGNGNYVIDENRKKIGWATGIDTKKEFVEKNICLDEIIIGNLEQLPFEDNCFDIVVSLWVIEHLEKPETVFRELNRVIKPGGYFIFATPNAYYLPLKLVSMLKSAKINHFLNKVLFGRDEDEIFKTYYKANTLPRLRELSKNLFEIKELRLNKDPSYTSFNKLTYELTKYLIQSKIIKKKFIYPHIVGILKTDKI